MINCVKRVESCPVGIMECLACPKLTTPFSLNKPHLQKNIDSEAARRVAYRENVTKTVSIKTIETKLVEKYNIQVGQVTPFSCILIVE